MQQTTSAFPAYGQYSIADLMAAYRAGPDRLERALHGLTAEELLVRSRGPGTWSAQEIAIHTADSELQGVYRMRKAWSQPGAPLPGYDQEAWAASLAYQQGGAAALRQALDLFRALRATGVSLLEQADGADWDRWGSHPDFGRVTFRNLLELYADHSERHIAHILETRARLGNPLDLPLLLPDRLY